MEQLIEPVKKFRNKPNHQPALMEPFDKTSWTKVCFGDVCRNVNETSKDPLAEGLERYVGLEHIEPGSLHIKSWGNVADGTTFTKTFRAGQVLFGKRRAYQRKAALADFDGLCSGDILVFEAIEEMIDPMLLPFLVQSDGFFDFAVKTSAGSLSPRTKFQDLAKYEFLLPRKEHQAKLAELLWAGDELIESQRKLLSQIITAQVVYALGNYSDQGMPMASLASIADVNPKSASRGLDDDLEVTFLTMADVSEDGQILNRQTRKLKDVKKGFTAFQEGDILFAKITPCMENGKGGFATDLKNGIGYGSTEFHVIRAHKESDRLFCFFLSQMNNFREEAEKMMVGSAGQKRVPGSFLSNFTFNIPNDLRRNEFGKKMQLFEDQKIHKKNLISQTKKIQQCIINQIFS